MLLLIAALNARGTDGQPQGNVPIRERPANVHNCAIPWHWEGDVITGSNNTHITMLVEWYSRLTLLVKVPTKDTASVVAALIQRMHRLPFTLSRSLTWDRGMEMTHPST